MSNTQSPGEQGLTEREIVAIGKAFADPRRMSILIEIASTDVLHCQVLRKDHPVSAATISHHMKELEAAGLVEILRDGKFACMRVRGDTIRRYIDALGRIFAMPLETADR